MATISKLPSGKFRARVRVKGSYRSESFATKSGALRWAATIESQLRDRAAGVRVVVKGTVADLIDKYLEEAKQPGRTKRSTLEMFGRRIGHIAIEDIGPVLQDFVTLRLKEGAASQTIAGELANLSSVLRWAGLGKGIAIDENAARDARASLTMGGHRTKSRERDRLPTENELQRLYDHWNGSDRQTIPMADIVRFAALTAMRQGEITRIRIEDVDSEGRTVMVRDRKDPNQKLGNDQIIPVVPDAYDVMLKHIGSRTSGAVFAFDSRSISTNFTRACKALGIEDLHFHDLRHYATTNFFRLGLSIPEVALITGHKSWENLKRYTQINAADVHKVLQR